MQASLEAYNAPNVPANSSPQPNAVPILDAAGGLTVNKFTAQGQATAYSNAEAFSTVTGSATETTAFGVIRINAAGGAITRTLPAASASTNQIIRFKRIDSSGNAVTIAAGSGDTIDGAATNTSLSSQYTKLALFCNGVSWDII